MQIRCNFPDNSYLSETQKNNLQFLSKGQKSLHKQAVLPESSLRWDTQSWTPWPQILFTQPNYIKKCQNCRVVENAEPFTS